MTIDPQSRHIRIAAPDYLRFELPFWKSWHAPCNLPQQNDVGTPSVLLGKIMPAHVLSAFSTCFSFIAASTPSTPMSTQNTLCLRVHTADQDTAVRLSRHNAQPSVKYASVCATCGIPGWRVELGGQSAANTRSSAEW